MSPRSAVRLTVETRLEGLGLVRYFKLDGNEHAVIRITAKKGRGFKAMLIQPDTHRRHLPAEVSLIHADVYSEHTRRSIVAPSANHNTSPVIELTRRR